MSPVNHLNIRYLAHNTQKEKQKDKRIRQILKDYSNPAAAVSANVMQVTVEEQRKYSLAVVQERDGDWGEGVGGGVRVVMTQDSS